MLEPARVDFLADCAARTACAFHEKGKSARAFDTLMGSIERTSLPAVLVRDGRRVGPGLAWSAVVGALYSKDSWRILAQALELAKLGDGSLLLAIADPFRGRKPNGSYSNLQDAYTANTCLDFAAPKDVTVYAAWASTFKSTAPHFGQLLAYNDLACAFWPVPAERTPKAATGTGAPPIVVIGSTLDPATPYAWAVALSKELASGVLVTRDGEGHTAYRASECVRTAIGAYLLDVKVPKDGLTCKT